MSEYRQDRTTGAWVIVAPERGERPHSRHPSDATPVMKVSAHDPNCPFCPGNEHLLQEIIEETPSDKQPWWAVRVLSNKFPAVSPLGSSVAPFDQSGSMHPGYGFHEVIVETSRHDGDLTTVDPANLPAIVSSYRRRHIILSKRPGIEGVLLFRNHGRMAGASIAHPHSQAIAVALMPPRLAAASNWMRAEHERRGRCVTCEMIEAELAEGKRIVAQSERFVLLVPFAATSPFEMWLIPRLHQPSFGEISESDLVEFAGLLQCALRGLQTALEDPPYRFVFESWGSQETSFAHWRLRIVPNLTMPGGFELGSGLTINPAWPEDDAEVLRAICGAHRTAI